MTFTWPIALLALLLLPAIVALEVLLRRRRPRYAVAFPNVELLGTVAGRGWSWRRIARLALLLAALATLIVGLARPLVPTSVARRSGTVMLALDVSGSMVSNDVAPTRLGAATKAASEFVQGLPKGFDVGLVPFSTSAQVQVAPTTDRARVQSALASLRAGGGTAIGDAIELALGASNPHASSASQRGKGREILLLSDGANTAGVDPLQVADEAHKLGVRIDTIAFGTPNGTVDLGPYNGGVQLVPPDPATLRAVARISGGTFFAAADEQTLRQVYQRIGRRVESTTGHREVTFAFAAAGAALLAAAAALSLRWRSPLT